MPFEIPIVVKSFWNEPGHTLTKLAVDSFLLLKDPMICMTGFTIVSSLENDQGTQWGITCIPYHTVTQVGKHVV